MHSVYLFPIFFVCIIWLPCGGDQNECNHLLLYHLSNYHEEILLLLMRKYHRDSLPQFYDSEISSSTEHEGEFTQPSCIFFVYH